MTRLPVLKARELVHALERAGFEAVRQRGSHLRMKHADGRLVTVPVHAGQDIGRGLLRKILRDLELTPEEFLDLLK
jgi:predicted RNA binding protein YcfA (HicA-like mRNA interferase family)